MMDGEQGHLDAFRAEIAAWIDQNAPTSLRQRAFTEEDICWGGRNWQFKSEDQKRWLELCAARGLTAPRWAKDYGGAGLSRAEEKIFLEEMDRLQVKRPLESFGLWMLGP
ncbi:MAG: acyl-CoA dehydrogenase family protein, partial [Maritimibacter sp.]